MATAKKSANSRTAKPARKSTAKKPAAKTTAKTTKKTSAAKTTTATTKKTVKKDAKSEKPTPVSVASSVKVTKTSKVLTPLEKIRSLHFQSTVIYVFLAGIAAIFMSAVGTELLLNYQARDTFILSDNVILGNASEVLYTVSYRYVLIAGLALGAIGSILLATVLRKRYENTVKAGISGYRWILFGISTAVLVELASFTAGVQDLMTLKLIAGLVLVAALFGWMSERENSGASSPKRLAFYASIFAYFLALLPMLSSMFGTSFYGAERFSWFVYALGGAVLLQFVANLWNQKSSMINTGKFEYAVYEQRYIRIDQVAKFLIWAILLIAIID